MFRCLKQQLPLVRVAGVISFLVLSTRAVSAQSAPVSPDHPWHTSTEIKDRSRCQKYSRLEIHHRSGQDLFVAGAD